MLRLDLVLRKWEFVQKLAVTDGTSLNQTQVTVFMAVLDTVNHVLEWIRDFTSRVLSIEELATSRAGNFSVASKSWSDSIYLIWHPVWFLNPLAMSFSMMFSFRLTVDEEQTTSITLSDKIEFPVLWTVLNTVDKVGWFSKHHSDCHDCCLEDFRTSFAVNFGIEVSSGQALLRNKDSICIVRTKKTISYFPSSLWFYNWVWRTCITPWMWRICITSWRWIESNEISMIVDRNLLSSIRTWRLGLSDVTPLFHQIFEGLSHVCIIPRSIKLIRTWECNTRWCRRNRYKTNMSRNHVMRNVSRVWVRLTHNGLNSRPALTRSRQTQHVLTVTSTDVFHPKVLLERSNDWRAIVE